MGCANHDDISYVTASVQQQAVAGQGRSIGQTAPPLSAKRVSGSASSASRGRRIFQVLIALLSWITFAVLWMWQIGDYKPSNLELYPAFIGAALVIMLGIGRGWIQWNRSIYRRRHNRNSPVVREVDFSHDAIGRPVHCHADLRYAAGQLIVSVDDDGAKVYRPGRRPRPVDSADVPEPVSATRPHWFDHQPVGIQPPLAPTTYLPESQLHAVFG